MTRLTHSQKIICLGLSLFTLNFPSFAEMPIKIVTLHPLWAEMANELGGDRVTAYSILPNGQDPHYFEPFPKDLKNVAQCDLLLASGKGLETYVGKLREQLGAQASYLELGASIPDSVGGEACTHSGSHDHHHHAIDPHWWLNPNHMMRAARQLSKMFVEIDPVNEAYYSQRLLAYRKSLRALDQEMQNTLKNIPEAQRLLALAHPAFAYFCEAYGFKQISVAGLSQEALPSASDLKDIIHLLVEEKVRALFPEVDSNPKLLAAVSEASGVIVASPLYVDSLPPDHPNYAGLMRQNAKLLAETLGEAKP